MLSDKDKDTFSWYILNYAPSGDAYMHGKRQGDMDIILQPWAKAKEKHLFRMFQNQLILEKEVEYNEPEDNIRSALNESLVKGKMGPFYRAVRVYCERRYSIFSTDIDYILNLFSTCVLARNSFNYECSRTIIINETAINFQEGAKPMRLLNKIAKAIGLEEEFENFRLEHSRLLNQQKLKGTLCLSIHPMDYVTMSDNANRWSSCMSWRNDGDYRMGTVEMLNSPCVVVAYLKGSDDLLLEQGFKWNSKKWRCLFVVDKNIIVSVKDYPFCCPELKMMCASWLRDLAVQNLMWDFPYDIGTLSIDHNNFIYPSNHNKYYLNIHTDCASMYNDFNCTDAHYGTLARAELQENTIYVNINYAGVNECMWCGETKIEVYEHNYVVGECCCDCGSRYYCDCCGASLHEDDTWWLNDEPYCWDCYADRTEECALSGERYDPDDLVEVYYGDDYIKIHHCYVDGHWSIWDNEIIAAPHWNEELMRYEWYDNDLIGAAVSRYF